MNVLVTGSHGFLGSAVASCLEGRGHGVIGFDLRNHSDPQDFGGLVAASRGADAVIHLGAPSSSLLFHRNPLHCWDMTVSPLARLLEEFSGRIVIASSCTVYGNQADPAVESMRLPIPPNLYAAAKVECERLGLAAVVKGSDVAIARIFTGYGPGERHKRGYASPIWQFASSAVSGRTIELFGNGGQLRDFVFVEDIAEALVCIAESSPTNRIVNVGTGVATSFNEVVEVIEAEVGRPLNVDLLPKPPGYISRIVASTAFFEAEYGWKPTTGLRDGIRRILLEITS